MKIILAIDDDKPTLSLLSAQLEGLRYRMFTETSPRKGVELSRTLNPDVILLDINMPEMNGIEVLKALKKDSITQNVPVIMLTAVTSKDVVIQAMKHGIIDYLVKPWDKDNILLKIEAAFKYREMQKIEARLEDSEYIYIARDQKTVVLSFRDSLGSKKFLVEVRSVFNSFFLGQLRNKICIIDLRALGDFELQDVKVLDLVIKLFGAIPLNIIAGRHYGTIVANSDIDERVHLFISYGDMEQYLGSQGKA